MCSVWVLHRPSYFEIYGLETVDITSRKKSGSWRVAKRAMEMDAMLEIRGKDRVQNEQIRRLIKVSQKGLEKVGQKMLSLTSLRESMAKAKRQ